MDEIWDDLIESLGKPVACAICHRERPARELRELEVPSRLIFDGQIVVHEIVWVCASGC